MTSTAVIQTDTLTPLLFQIIFWTGMACCNKRLRGRIAGLWRSVLRPYVATRVDWNSSKP